MRKLSKELLLDIIADLGTLPIRLSSAQVLSSGSSLSPSSVASNSASISPSSFNSAGPVVNPFGQLYNSLLIQQQQQQQAQQQLQPPQQHSLSSSPSSSASALQHHVLQLKFDEETWTLSLMISFNLFLLNIFVYYLFFFLLFVYDELFFNVKKNLLVFDRLYIKWSWDESFKNNKLFI